MEINVDIPILIQRVSSLIHISLSVIAVPNSKWINEQEFSDRWKCVQLDNKHWRYLYRSIGNLLAQRMDFLLLWFQFWLKLLQFAYYSKKYPKESISLWWVDKLANICIFVHTTSSWSSSALSLPLRILDKRLVWCSSLS